MIDEELRSAGVLSLRKVATFPSSLKGRHNLPARGETRRNEETKIKGSSCDETHQTTLELFLRIPVVELFSTLFPL